MTRFTHWLAEIQRLAEREPIAAVRDLIHGMDYESWLYKHRQPESRRNAHEERQPTV
ncbi:hypothetical protein ACNKHR_12290 [Shigella flexneri]